MNPDDPDDPDASESREPGRADHDSKTDAARDAQWERAHQAWSLFVEADPSGLDSAELGRLYRVLRTKRSERADLHRRLPGVVRRGARIDLDALAESLRAAGFECHLVRSADRSANPLKSSSAAS